jgi:ABC-type phosphate transport system substrate-binding protein
MLKRYCLLLILFLVFTAPAYAEDIVVIVNKKNGVDTLSKDEVLDIFMGRNRKLSSGVTAVPLDLPDSEADRQSFYYVLTGKNINQINAYWARLVLTGHATPPVTLHNEEAVIQRVSDNRNAIGYISRRKMNAQVKIVFELKE